MSLSFTHLPTHWNADEAYTVIAFLDLLRDLLWETYGDDITAMLRDRSSTSTKRERTPIGLSSLKSRMRCASPPDKVPAMRSRVSRISNRSGMPSRVARRFSSTASASCPS